MESNIYSNETNNIDLSNQTLSSIKSITFIEINNILSGTHLNSQRLDQLLETIQSTGQLHLKGGRLRVSRSKPLCQALGGLLMRFGTMGTMPNGLREKE
jgi:hypothetical protein